MNILEFVLGAADRISFRLRTGDPGSGSNPVGRAHVRVGNVRCATLVEFTDDELMRFVVATNECRQNHGGGFRLVSLGENLSIEGEMAADGTARVEATVQKPPGTQGDPSWEVVVSFTCRAEDLGRSPEPSNPAGDGASQRQETSGPPSPEALARRRQWFDDYVDALNHQPPDLPMRCPCCLCTTLTERGGYEICPVCFWEDDGQDDHDADAVRGGPNGRLSLTQARANYLEYGACEERSVRSVRAPRADERPEQETS